MYRDGLGRIGLNPLDATASWLDWLEHARHHGVPAPLIDFSWSPYVALFFAYDGVGMERRGAASVVLALHTGRLARHWALAKRAERARFFELSDPGAAGELRLCARPGPFVERMHRQLGAFLYCTLDYDELGVRDLEEYLDRIDEAAEAERAGARGAGSGPVLTKVVLRHAWARAAFERLELMNINGATLLLSAEGVAKDVLNAHHYASRVARLRREETRSEDDLHFERGRSMG
jgi:hypothetical protein